MSGYSAIEWTDATPLRHLLFGLDKIIILMYSEYQKYLQEGLCRSREFAGGGR